MADWLPIESAPTDDGVVVLLWDRCFEQPVVGTLSRGKWWVENTYGFCEDGEIPRYDISHWMPAPQSPTKSEQK